MYCLRLFVAFVAIRLVSLGLCNKTPPAINNVVGEWAYLAEAKQAAEALARRHDRLACVGFGACALHACVGSTGILVCNDRHDTIYPTATWIAIFAFDILSTPACVEGNQVKGQMFDSDGYNVVVRKATC